MTCATHPSLESKLNTAEAAIDCNQANAQVMLTKCHEERRKVGWLYVGAEEDKHDPTFRTA